MNILMVDGSGREGSYNRKLLNVFAALVHARLPTAVLTTVSPASHPVPNLIPGTQYPDGTASVCEDLRAKALAADAFVIASPEYNGGPTGGLKNLCDWMSYPSPAAPEGNPFEMKPTVLLSASPGSLGGIKGLQVLRLILGHLRALILPEQVALAQADEAFDESGGLLPSLAMTLAESAAGQLEQALTGSKRDRI